MHRNDTERDQHQDYEPYADSEYEAEMRAEWESEMRTEMPSQAEIEEWERSSREFERAQYEKMRVSEDLADFHVGWSEITLDVGLLSQAIDEARREEDVQRFLTENKWFLVPVLGGGHGVYVLPKPRLGRDLVPDYLRAETDSMGVHWCGLELESPLNKMCTATGQPTAGLTHAIQQVVEWREWLKNNIAHAGNPTSEGGLGLVGIDGNLPAIILMGRRQEFPVGFNAFRRQTKSERKIEIHTFDWLIDQARSRAEMIKRDRRSRDN